MIYITLASAFWVVMLLLRLRATSFMAVTVFFSIVGWLLMSASMVGSIQGVDRTKSSGAQSI